MKNWCLKVLFGGALALVATTTFAQGDVQAGQAASAVCAACHGANGVSSNPEWPSLAGLGETYIFRQLQAFKSGERKDPLMSPQAQALNEQQMQDLAAYYASLGQMQPAGASEELVELGEQIYFGGLPEKGVPACAACHGPVGAGNPAAAYPAIGGQQPVYLVKQLTAYRLGERATDPNSMMRDIAGKLSDEEIQAVSSYAAGLYRAQ